MNLSTFITKRRPDWRRLEDVLRRVEGSGLGSLDEEQATEFGRLYRRAAVIGVITFSALVNN